MPEPHSIQVENKGLFVQIIQSRFVLVQTSLKSLDLYDLADMRVVLRVISPALEQLAFFDPQNTYHVSSTPGATPILVAAHRRTHQLTTATAENKVSRLRFAPKSGYRLAGSYLLVMGNFTTEIHLLSADSVTLMNIPTEIQREAVTDIHVAEGKVFLLGRDRLVIHVLQQRGLSELALSETVQVLPLNNHFQNIELVEWNESVHKRTGTIVLSDAEGNFYLLKLSPSAENPKQPMRLPGVFQEALYDPSSKRMYARDGKQLTVYEIGEERTDRGVVQTFSNEFTFARSGRGALLFLSVTETEVLFQKNDFESVVLPTVRSPVAASQSPSQGPLNDSLSSLPTDPQSKSGSSKARAHLARPTFGHLDKLLAVGVEIPDHSFTSVFFDLLRLNSFALFETFLGNFRDKMSPQLRDITQTLTTFAQNFGFACVSYHDLFLSRPVESPLPTPADVLVALLTSHAKELGSIMKEKDLIVFSEIPTLDLEAAKHEFALHLVRVRSPLLFEHLDLDHLQTLFHSTIDTANFPFFQTHQPLIRSNEKISEIFSILANFRITFDRSTSSHDFSLLCMQLVRSYLAGNYVHAVIEYEREHLYFQQFNIVKVYNTFYYILADLHALLAGKLVFPPTNPRFTDATLLECFFKELLRAGLTGELYDLANFKKEAISVPAFESDLFHFAQNSTDHSTLLKLKALVDKLRGLRIFSYKLDVIGQLVESRLFLEAERLNAFEDAFVYKDPADFARNFSGYFKGFKRQLKVKEFEERERKADLGHPSTREEYRAAIQTLKVDKDWTLRDPQMVEFITRTIDLFTLHAKDLKFDSLFDSLVEIGVRQIFLGVLSRFLKSDGIPPQFFELVESKNRLKPFLMKAWPIYNDSLTLTENLIVFMAAECSDYESLSNLLRASKNWTDYSRRSDLVGGKRFIAYRRDALEDVVELKMEKKGVEEVEGWDNTPDKTQEARAKVVVRYLLSDPPAAQFFFSKFFPLTTPENLDVNFGILLRIVRASWKFKGTGIAPATRTSQFFSEILESQAKGFSLKDHPRFQALRLFCLLSEKELPHLSPTLFDEIYDLEKLDKLLSHPGFAESLLRLEPLVVDVLTRFVQRNTSLLRKDLPSLRVLESVLVRNLPAFLAKAVDNNCLYNLTVLSILIQRGASPDLEKVRLLSLLPTATLNAVALVQVAEGQLRVQEEQAAAILAATTDQVVQSTLAAILRPAAIREKFRSEMAEIMNGI